MKALFLSILPASAAVRSNETIEEVTMSIVRSWSTHWPAARTPRLPGLAILLFVQLAGCAGIVAVAEPLSPSIGEAQEASSSGVALHSDLAEAIQRMEPRHPEARGIKRASVPRGGRYQVASLRESPGWLILDTETGKFEHWVPVAGTSRYHVFGCKFEGGCSILDKRSVDRGLDP